MSTAERAASKAWSLTGSLASWRLPYGQSGILDFFLRLIASSEITDNELLLHSLRLSGNSCADTGKCVCVSLALWHTNPI